MIIKADKEGRAVLKEIIIMANKEGKGDLTISTNLINIFNKIEIIQEPVGDKSTKSEG